MIPDSYDYPLSVALAHHTHAEPYRCWRNAVVALLACADLLPNASYVEGWIVLPRPTTIDIVEHGWIMADQQILDPSLVLVEAAAQPVWYFAGFLVPSQDLAHRLQGTILPLVCHSSYGADGMGHPEYKDASTRARQYALHLAQQRHLPETALAVSGRAPTDAVTLIASA